MRALCGRRAFGAAGPALPRRISPISPRPNHVHGDKRQASGRSVSPSTASWLAFDEAGERRSGLLQVTTDAENVRAVSALVR